MPSTWQIEDSPDLQNPVHEPVVRSTGVAAEADSDSQMEQGLALCLSGGGYRATVYHVGVFWRLNELGLLSKLKRISSVSGGSITAGTLGRNWGQLKFQGGVASEESFRAALVKPIRAMTAVTIDLPAVGWGIFSPTKTIGEKIAAYYDQYLFHGDTLQSLPSDWDAEDEDAANPVVKGPRFVINATNVMTGSLWRFAKPYMADYRVGIVKAPKVPLATAVAASSAFPPFLSPTKVELSGLTFEPDVPKKNDPLFDPRFRNEAVLTDGGVYDNLGLETVWKRYTDVLISDAGRRMADDPAPATDWAQHSRRLLDLLQFQTSNLRRRQVMSALLDKNELHDGAYWGIQSDLANPVFDAATGKLPYPIAKSRKMANIETRLAAMDDDTQERLINWGYAICDASIRSFFYKPGNRYFDASANPLPQFPYPARL